MRSRVLVGRWGSPSPSQRWHSSSPGGVVSCSSSQAVFSDVSLDFADDFKVEGAHIPYLLTSVSFPIFFAH